jgi:hypothetical protein
MFNIQNSEKVPVHYTFISSKEVAMITILFAHYKRVDYDRVVNDPCSTWKTHESLSRTRIGHTEWMAGNLGSSRPEESQQIL